MAADRTRAGAVSIATPAAPKGGGTIRGMGESFSADEFTGTASLALPIELPAARGLKPDLTLTYHSGSANGPFGVGFDVGLAAFYRQTSKRIPRYQSDDVIVHSQFGELAVVDAPAASQAIGGMTYTATRFRPRKESDYPLIELWSAPGASFWTVVDRDTVTSVFGYDDSARISDPADPSRVFKWLVQETFDTKGNHVLYEYKAEDGSGCTRAVTTNRYPARIRYGDASPVAASMLLTLPDADLARLQWHFHVIFDYGEYSEDAARPDQPVQAWSARPDSFSAFSAGFEIRTCRLCRSVLTFHQFPQDLGPDPVLVRAMRLRYDESPFVSLLTRIEYVGFRIDPAQPTSAREIKPLAPMEFTYTDFSLTEGTYRSVAMDIPSGPILPEDDLDWVDLYGNGIPGLLHSGADGVRYWEPRLVDPATAEVAYDGPKTIGRVPLAAYSAGRQLTLADVAGTGRLQWLSTIPGQEGIAPIAPDGSSAPLQMFRSFPNDYRNPDRELVNLTGTGLPDLVLMGATSVDVYPCLGSDGYADLLEAPSVGTPPSEPGLVTEVRRFADMFGSGQQHYVRIRNGSVTCWPNLGYGRFGEPVEFDNAPYFGDDFDPARLFLADLDGSGAVDIAFVAPDCVRVYRNQSGNGFADVVEIPLPVTADELTRIHFADVLGVGLTCLVVTQVDPVLQHWYYVVGEGKKPHLLATVCNNTGLTTEIAYDSSVHDYLADRARGIPWITTPPFPVNVVKSVTHRDALAEADVTKYFSYRHGYYDSDELTFMGFGFVERRDAESFDQLAGKSEDPYVVPPVVERTWYHTGARLAGASLESLYRAEYFGGDAAAYPMPECALAFVERDGASVREAYWSLAGNTLHQEVYGDDGSPWTQVPYHVWSHRYLATQLQAKAVNAFSVFTTQPLESIDCVYERNGADPRITHDYTLDVDAYGNTLRSCSVAYPRRPGADGPAAQSVLLASLSASTFHNVTDAFYRIGAPADEAMDEISGLSLSPGGAYIAYEDLERQLQGVSGIAPPVGAVSATRLEWRRFNYQPSGDTSSGAPPFSPQALLLSSDEAEYDRSALAQAFAGALTAEALTQLMTSVAPDGGGYRTDATGAGANYWWNPGETMAYAGPEGFYQPISRTDPFGWTVTSAYDAYGLFAAKVQDAFGNETAATHIDYQALEYDGVRDPNGSIMEVRCDALGMVVVNTFYGSEGGRSAGFAPLSSYVVPAAAPSFDAVVADPESWLQGAANFFFADVLAWTGQVAPAAFASLGIDGDALWADLDTRGYITREGVVCNAVRALESADDFVLSPVFAGVASAVYAILRAAPSGRPVADVQLAATQYPGKTASPIEIRIAYFDGMQRALQQKIKCVETQQALAVSPAGATASLSDQSWLTSGAVRYNAKGLPVRRFEPFFSADAAFNPLEAAIEVGVSATLWYDALSRLVYTETPLQTIRKTLFGDVTGKPAVPLTGYLTQKLYGSLGAAFQPSPWTILNFDENDTIKDSPYYQSAIGGADSYEQAALQGAALCFNTPTRMLIDPLGRQVRAIQQNDGIVTAGGLQSLGYGAADAQTLFAALQSGGYLDARGALTAAFQPDQKGFVLTLPAQFTPDAAKIIAYLSAVQRAGALLTIDTTLDLRGSPLRIADNRLAAAGVANFETVYSLTKSIVRSHGADAGTRWELRNATGHGILEQDSRGIAVTTGYDALARITRVEVLDAEAVKQQVVPQQAVRILYGDSCYRACANDPWQPYFADAAQWNLRGKPVVQADRSGLALSPFYSVLEQPYAQARAFRADCATELDWTAVPDAAFLALAQGLGALTDPSMLATLKLPDDIQKPLEAKSFVESSTYDGKGRLVSRTDADGNVTAYRFNLRALIDQVTFTPSAPGAGAMSIRPIAYDAHDRPVAMTEGGTVQITHRYDPLTFYLVQITATSDGGAPATLQDVTYYRDPVGNVTAAIDRAPLSPTGAPETKPVVTTYGYDLLYRLIAANGRQRSVTAPAGPAVPYSERYGYDDSGNLIRVDHVADGAAWSNLHTVDTASNRLVKSAMGAPSASVVYRYDGNGNLTNSDTASVIAWTYANQPLSITAGGGIEYYLYDADGQRLRKVRQTLAQGVQQVEEVTYAGPLEITRNGSGASQENWTAASEWHAVRVSAGGSYLARWINWVTGTPPGLPAAAMRYQLADVVGSVSTEIDAHAQPVTHEEYFPYGADAMTWEQATEDLALKRYRYAGKERDAATNLDYYGARYYSSSLMRWLSPDPAGPVDGLNLYRFVRGNPVTYADADGRMRIHHWNVKDKTGPQLAQAKFVTALAAFLDKASSKQGTVIFLTEIMGSVNNGHRDTLVNALNKKAGRGWSGHLIYAGTSEGGTRLERILVLTHGVTPTALWKIVAPSTTSDRTERFDLPSNAKHQRNDRFIVGVDVETRMTGSPETLSIGSYHNLGPSTGAHTRASYWRGEARRHNIHVVIGDWNVEPPEPAKKKMKTRQSDTSEAVTFDNVATSRGGSYYDYALSFNATLGDRDLTVQNETGSRHESSDHAQNSATINTRKRKR